MNSLIRLAALVLALAPLPAAACDNLDSLLRAAYPTATKDNGNLVLGESAVPNLKSDYQMHISPDDVACRVWPFKPEFTLLAVPLVEAPDGEGRGNVEVIVADTKTGQPMARRVEKSMADSGGMRFDQMQIDTARYNIGNGERAFGVTTQLTGQSRPNPYNEKALWLYNLKGRSLERIMDGLIVEFYAGEFDSVCAGRMEDIKRTVTMARLMTHSDGALLVDQMSKASRTEAKGDDCEEVVGPEKTRQFKLQLQNGRYQPARGAGADDLFSSIVIDE